LQVCKELVLYQLFASPSATSLVILDVEYISIRKCRHTSFQELCSPFPRL